MQTDFKFSEQSSLCVFFFSYELIAHILMIFEVCPKSSWTTFQIILPIVGSLPFYLLCIKFETNANLMSIKLLSIFNKTR